jgi:hypothetical protein
MKYEHTTKHFIVDAKSHAKHKPNAGLGWFPQNSSNLHQTLPGPWDHGPKTLHPMAPHVDSDSTA